jgi:hypothetical protein
MHQPARLACHDQCRPDPERQAHHDRLLQVESDPDAMVDLFETAVTWAELEYSPKTTIPPHEWLDFAGRHRWHDADRIQWIFGLATDMALRAASAADREPARWGSSPAPGSARRSIAWSRGGTCGSPAPERPPARTLLTSS